MGLDRSRGPGQGRAGLAVGPFAPGGPTGSKHERSYAKDRGGAQHHGHGDQLDVSDSALSGGTQRDHRLQRGHLGEDCQRAYDFLFFFPQVSVHSTCPCMLSCVNVRKEKRM